MTRPQHLAVYKRNVAVPALAAAYGWALLRNHPFVDVDKRIALAAMVVFLDLNGGELTCTQAEETAMILRAAAGRDQRTGVEVGRAQRKEEGLTGAHLPDVGSSFSSYIRSQAQFARYILLTY
jgi:death on curing protein